MNGERSVIKKGFIVKKLSAISPFPSFFLILITTCLSISAQMLPTNFGDVTVGIEVITTAHMVPDRSTGYEEYRATIINRSSTKTHQVTLIGQNDPMRGDGPRYFELRRTVDVAPGATATVSLLKPLINMTRADFEILIDGERQEEIVYLNNSRAGAWVRQNINRLTVLASQKVIESGLMNDPVTLDGLKDSAGNLDFAYLAYDFPPNEWSVNWLGYSGFDGVIVTAEELNAMPHGVQSALQSYLECGGALQVIGSWAVPGQWTSRGEIINGLMTYYVGFGV